MAKWRWLLALVLVSLVWPLAGCGGAPGRIAFVTSPKGRGGYVVVTRTRGSADVIHITELGRCVNVSLHDQLWSRNGKLVYYEGAGREPLTWLSVIDADGIDQHRLLNVQDLDLSSVSISPDGTKVLVVYRDSRVVTTPFQGSARQDTFRFSAIDSINTATGEVRHLASVDNMSIDRAVYSPDGRRIAFVGRTDDPDTHFNIYIMNADGSGRRRLTDLEWGLNPFEPPRWSPDGRQILYSYETVFIDDITHYDDIFVVDVTSGRSTNLTSSPNEDDGHYSWSPDGQWIAFSSISTIDRWGVCVMDANGGNRREVAGHAGSPSWLPDSRHLLASGTNYDEATGRWLGAGVLEINLRTEKTKTVVPLLDTYGSLSYPIWVGR